MNRKVKPAVALAAFFKLAEQWEVNRKESALLLGVSVKTLKQCEESPGRSALNRDTIERISLLINIWADLRSNFRFSKDALRWLRAPNDFFGDMAPLERMLAGNVTDIAAVRHRLDV